MTALESRNTPEVLQAMMNAYVFEKNLCEKCAHLSRIARAIDSGSIQVNTADPYSKVEYLIFELAQGDVRSHLDLQQQLDVVFVLKALHHVATGIAQLHNAGIAHQDLKPSNVLVYKAHAGAKICDLGRAWDRNMPNPYDKLPVAGDRTYAPPELLYNHVSPEEWARRFGCDMYHLGSLVVFLFSRAHTNALLFDCLAPLHRPAFWGGSYADVLPFLQAAFEITVQTFGTHVPRYIRPELECVVTELCNPDQRRRGHPLNSGSSQFSFERYISIFNRLAHSARLALA